jgi:2'-5' RNA ligase
MTERWRLFVAVPIGEELRQALSAAVEAWRADSQLVGIRWSEPDAWHVTVAFLGSVEADAVDGIATTIRSVAAGHDPVRLTTGGLGAFPAARRARVLWYGIADRDGRLATLAAELAMRLGLELTSGQYRPHLTLARSKRQAVDVRRWLASAVAPDATLAVEQLALMRSHLGRGPARYERLSSAAVGEAEDV